MKRIFVLAILLMTFTTVYADSPDITVQVDGTQLSFDVPPVMSGDRVLVPVRAIFDSLKANIAWDDATQTVTAVKEDTTIKITIDSSTMYINDKATELDVPAIVMNGRTLIPTRAVSQALGAEVSWNDDTQTVNIKSAEQLLKESIVKMLNDMQLDEQ